MIRAVSSIRAMEPYALSDPVPFGTVSLAQNESAFPVSPRAIAAGQTALVDMVSYCDPDWTDLRHAIAEVHGIGANNILCGAGSMELIGALIRAFVGPGDDILGTAYGYLFVSTAAHQVGARYVAVPEPDMQVDPVAVLNAVTSQTKVVFLCNPGNPTGTRIDNAAIVQLRAGLPDSVLLVVDQAYGEFDDQPHGLIFDLVGRGDTIVLRTMSKAHGLAGARVGWACVPPAIGAEMRKVLNPNNVSAVSQAMAVAAMRDQAYMRDVVEQTAAIRRAFTATLRGLDYDPPESHTNFVLVPFASVKAARAADTQLRAVGLMARGMGGYGLGHCLRFTMGPQAAMVHAAEKLASFKERINDI